MGGSSGAGPISDPGSPRRRLPVGDPITPVPSSGGIGSIYGLGAWGLGFKVETYGL